MFQTYLELGFEHILDPNGYDHILFIIALCALYRYFEWRRILILVTAFTVGHSLTLALSALKIVTVDSNLIEFLIPTSILLTALYNIWKGDSEHQRVMINYGIALFFGLIHGMGFSNFFKSLLGREESITGPLLSFNIGVELGQIIIVAAIMLLNMIVIKYLKVPQKYWIYAVSGIAAVVSARLMMDAVYW